MQTDMRELVHCTVDLCDAPCIYGSYGVVSDDLCAVPIKPVCVALLQLYASVVFSSNYGTPQYFVPIIP